MQDQAQALRLTLNTLGDLAFADPTHITPDHSSSLTHQSYLHPRPPHVLVSLPRAPSRPYAWPFPTHPMFLAAKEVGASAEGSAR